MGNLVDRLRQATGVENEKDLREKLDLLLLAAKCLRNPFNFFVNLIAGLVVYTFREKKPSLNIRLPQALPAVVL